MPFYFRGQTAPSEIHIFNAADTNIHLFYNHDGNDLMGAKFSIAYIHI